MDWLLSRTLSFLQASQPSWRGLCLGLPLSVLWAAACLYFAGRLKRDYRLRTGYSRKVFHFLIFATVAAVHWRWGSGAVCIFGGGCSLVVFSAVWRGDGNLLYEAMAREKDAPHRTHYILAPYLATLIGGIASNVLFGPAALAGYLVAGVGDAIAEPVGTRWGRHPYRTPALRGVTAERTLEGSAAVFVASSLALALAVGVGQQVWLLPIIALAATVTEAVSPHGWDNATMQLLPSALVWAWFS